MQRICILLISPHEGQRHNDVTSFKAFPAICLCLLLECDTFFLGTAFSSPSHISSNDGRDGRFNDIAGIEREILGSRGSANLLVRTVVYVEEDIVGEASRGRKEEVARAGNIVAAIVDSIATCLGAAEGVLVRR